MEGWGGAGDGDGGGFTSPTEAFISQSEFDLHLFIISQALFMFCHLCEELLNHLISVRAHPLTSMTLELFM